MNQAEEDYLVLAAQNGNADAFGLLYKKYKTPLFRFAFSYCQNSDTAQDIVQEVWLKIAKSLRGLSDPRAFKSWLYQQVKWRALDVIKQKKHQPPEQEFDDSIHGETLEQAIEASSDLKSAIKRLPNREREMINLFYMDELTLCEIAIICDVPVGTVKSRLNRARQMLAHKFGNN